MAGINAALELDDTGVPTIQRQEDKNIMDAILESNKFTAAQICRLNLCRLYLQAITTSDLTDASGKALDPYKLAGNPTTQSST
jgi:hypothetical protein